MAVKKVGELVKEARTAAGFTQEKLAQKAGEGLTASDIGKCERGTMDLTVNQLKRIAVSCGVTQTSLVNAPRNLADTKKKSAAVQTKPVSEKTSSKAKTATAKTSAAKTASAQKSGKTASAKTSAPANANVSLKVTASEKKLIEAYRAANGDMKKVAMKVLKGEYGDKVTGLLNVVGGGSISDSAADGITDAIGNLLGSLLGGK